MAEKGGKGKAKPKREKPSVLGNLSRDAPAAPRPSANRHAAGQRRAPGAAARPPRRPKRAKPTPAPPASRPRRPRAAPGWPRPSRRAARSRARRRRRARKASPRSRSAAKPRREAEGGGDAETSRRSRAGGRTAAARRSRRAAKPARRARGEAASRSRRLAAPRSPPPSRAAAAGRRSPRPRPRRPPPSRSRPPGRSGRGGGRRSRGAASDPGPSRVGPPRRPTAVRPGARPLNARVGDPPPAAHRARAAGHRDSVTTAIQAAGELAQVGLDARRAGAQARRRPAAQALARSLIGFPPPNRRMVSGERGTRCGPLEVRGGESAAPRRSAASSARARQLTS